MSGEKIAWFWVVMAMVMVVIAAIGHSITAGLGGITFMLAAIFIRMGR